MVTQPVLARRHMLVKQELANYNYSVETPLMVSARTSAGIVKMRRAMLFLVDGLDRAREVALWKKSIAQMNNKPKFNSKKLTTSRWSKSQKTFSKKKDANSIRPTTNSKELKSRGISSKTRGFSNKVKRARKK